MHEFLIENLKISKSLNVNFKPNMYDKEALPIRQPQFYLLTRCGQWSYVVIWTWIYQFWPQLVYTLCPDECSSIIQGESKKKAAPKFCWFLGFQKLKNKSCAPFSTAPVIQIRKMPQSGVVSMQGSNKDCLPMKGHTRWSPQLEGSHHPQRVDINFKNHQKPENCLGIELRSFS